jgi:IclR family pca regulon transcriptional regulator
VDEGKIIPVRSETMGGLAKGLAILEIFGAGAIQLTVADAARGSGTTRAAARRCLLTLSELGYLVQDGRYFTPLPKLRRLASAGSDHDALARIAQPILDHLRDRTQEAVSLAIRDGRDCWFIARSEPERIVQTGIRLGARVAAWSTAAGRLLLGALTDDQIAAYLDNVERTARTSRSIIAPDALFTLIARVRATGVSYSDEELELGMRAMAVPVVVSAQTVAAISMSTLTLRLSIKDMERDCRPLLNEAAAQLADCWRRHTA